MGERTDYSTTGYRGLNAEQLRKYKKMLPGYAKRFRYTCQACGRRFSVQSNVLSIHHIIPRREGGTDDFDNLILLCKPCHDEIEPEWEKYRTFRKISGCFESERTKPPEDKPAGLRWQQWVYGGYARPEPPVATRDLNENTYRSFDSE